MLAYSRILIVDTTKDFPTAAKRFLEARENVEAVKTASKAEALDAACSFKPDLLLLDIRLLTEDNRERKQGLCLRIKAVMPEISIIALTLYSEDINAKALKGGENIDAVVSRQNFAEEMLLFFKQKGGSCLKRV